MRFPLIIFFILLVLGIAHAASVDPKILTDLQDSNKVSVIVILEENATLGNASLSSSGFEKEKELGIINGLSGNITRSAIGNLLSNPLVESVHLNKPVSILLDGSVPLVNATQVWPLKINGINITGIGETICVIDTGINYTHPALGGGFGNKVIAGYDFVNSDNDSMDDNGHGTHVAGIIASSNLTYRGVAPDVSLVGIKALDSGGSGLESDVISGINWCVTNSTLYNISVISMSLGTSVSYSAYCDSSEVPFRDAINSAVAKNISIVVASGNNGFTANISAPSCIQNATPAGSTTKLDAISSFSNRNNITDLLAPGSSITSTVPTGSCSLCQSSGFSALSGTSMATPHVSAAFALLRQYKRLENGTLLKPGEIKSALKAAGKNITDSSTGLNFSRINILRSIVFLDASKPLLSISSPSNVTYNTTNITLAYSASDNIALDTCVFTNATGSSSALAGCSNITFTATANQQNNITITINDSNGNSNTSQVFFTIDTTAPLINVTSPQNLTYKTNNITINFSASDSNKIDRCWFVNNGTTIFLNSSGGNCSAATFIANQGSNNITAYVNDTGGNTNSSQVFFTVNLSFILSVQQPANTTYSSANVSVNYTISGFDTCWIINSTGGRINLSGCTNTSVLAIPNQLNNITLFVNNSNGDINSTQVFFTIDTLAPTANFTSPTPSNETIATNDITINVTFDSTPSIVLLEFNGTNYTMNGSLSRNLSFFDLADGNYSFRVFANDSAGNSNFTAFRWVFINATRNLSSFISSLNNSLVSNNVVLALLNTTGTGDASKVLLKTNYTMRFNITGIIAEVANFSWLSANTSNLINVTRNISLSNLSAAFNISGGVLDNYVWVDINNFTSNYTPKIVFAGPFRLNYYLNESKESPGSRRINDTCNSGFLNVPCYSIANNLTSIYLASFSGAAAGNDTQAPSIAIASPSGTLTDSNASLSYSASDNVAVDTCWYSLNNGANVTPANCSNTTFVPSSGLNTLVLYANDSSGNTNSSSTTFTYSPPSPAASSGGGGGGGGSSSAPPDPLKKAWNTITSSANVSFSIDSLPVRSISIFVNSTARNPSITLSPEKTGPVELENAYQYFSVNSTNLNSTTRAEITFVVNRTWLDFHEFNKSKVRLNRFDNGWIALQTRLRAENSTHVVYTSTSPGFSYFAITGERDPPPAQEKPICIQVITPAVKDGQCVNYPTPCDVPEGWTKVSECLTSGKNESTSGPGEAKPTPETAFLIVSAIAVILAVFAFHRTGRKKR